MKEQNATPVSTNANGLTGTLHAYASGSGSLSFVVRDENRNPAGRRPQAAECIDYVRSNLVNKREEPGQDDRGPQDWVIVNQGPLDRADHEHFEAVRKVERLAPDKLLFGGQEYTYDPAKLSDTKTPVFTRTSAISGKPEELDGWNNLGALTYFLRNEKVLSNPAHVVYDSQQERESAMNGPDAAEQESPSLWLEMAKAGVPMFHHATDLYVHVTAQTRDILAQFPLQKGNSTTFKANDDGKLMYDIPFAYEPEWSRKNGQNRLDVFEKASKGQHIGRVVDLVGGYALQSVGRGRLVVHDTKVLDQTVKVGDVIDVKYKGAQAEVKIEGQGKGGVER